jgi:hypothetical protein
MSFFETERTKNSKTAYKEIFLFPGNEVRCVTLYNHFIGFVSKNLFLFMIGKYTFQLINRAKDFPIK